MPAHLTKIGSFVFSLNPLGVRHLCWFNKKDKNANTDSWDSYTELDNWEMSQNSCDCGMNFPKQLKLIVYTQRLL